MNSPGRAAHCTVPPWPLAPPKSSLTRRTPLGDSQSTGTHLPGGRKTLRPSSSMVFNAPVQSRHRMSKPQAPGRHGIQRPWDRGGRGGEGTSENVRPAEPSHGAPHVRNHDLRAGVHLPDAFVLDPVVAAQAVRGAERLVALAARVFLHLLRRGGEREKAA